MASSAARQVMKNKFCFRCQTTKGVDQFEKNKTTRDGLNAWCIPCVRTYQTQWRIANPAQKAALSRRSMLKIKYSLTPEQWMIMFKKQKGKCWICKREPKDRHLDTDHCHKSGKVRGLLCISCNTLLSRARDDVKILRRAIRYLRK